MCLLFYRKNHSEFLANPILSISLLFMVRGCSTAITLTLFYLRSQFFPSSLLSYLEQLCSLGGKEGIRAFVISNLPWFKKFTALFPEYLLWMLMLGVDSNIFWLLCIWELRGHHQILDLSLEDDILSLVVGSVSCGTWIILSAIIEGINCQAIL